MNPIKCLDASTQSDARVGVVADAHATRVAAVSSPTRNVMPAGQVPDIGQTGRTSGRSCEEIEKLADRVARFRVNVLIVGETGVGKEVLAQRIHRRSPRAAGPLVAIDCAGLCATLIESQLFGYDRGAFTGATRSKPGLFEAANGGTVFLDEVGELPPSAQVKLLRVLETRTVRMLGSTTERPLDVRFVAATNRDLDREVKSGNFRADLLFRLDGMRFVLPPLRDRPNEVPTLALDFLAEVSSREGLPTPDLSPAAIEALLQHTWPGNIRELRNVMERAVVLCDSGTIGPEHLIIEQSGSVTSPFPEKRGDDMPEQPEDGALASVGGALPATAPGPHTRAAVIQALDRCAGNQTRAAALLGISRRTLVEKIKRFNLPRPQKSRRPLRGSATAPLDSMN